MPPWWLHKARRVWDSDAALGARTCPPHYAELQSVTTDGHVSPSALHVSMRLTCSYVSLRGA